MTAPKRAKYSMAPLTTQTRASLTMTLLTRSIATLSLIASLVLPNSVMASVDSASQLFKKGRHEEALQTVETALSAQPKDARGRFLKGLILTRLDRTSEAIEVFRKLTEDYPELPEPYNNLAVLYAQQKQYEKAKASLEMAIRTHPSYATAHENLGDIYARMASQAYNKALQLDGGNKGAQAKLAMINDMTAGTRSATAQPTIAAAPTNPVVIADARPAAAVTPAAPPGRPAVTKPENVTVPTSPPPAESTPTATPAEAAPKTPTTTAAVNQQGQDDDADLKAVVENWAAAWSRKDVAAYLAHYAADFATPRGQARGKWEAERRLRIDKPGKISIELNNLSVSLEGKDQATVRFRQDYSSASFRSSVNKSLRMVLRNGNWRIIDENVGG